MKIYTFFNKQRKREDGTFPVYICVSRPPKRLYIHTGLFTKVTFHDDIFPKSERNSKAKTLLLNDYLEKVEKIALENSLLPDRELRELINEKLFNRRSERYTLLGMFDEYISTLKSDNTILSYKSTRNKVEAFDSKVSINLTVKWVDSFVESMKAENISDNSIALHLKNVRCVNNYAIKQEITDNYPFKKYGIHTEQTRKRNLSVENIRKIINMEVGKTMKKYRDIFVLMFYLIGINGKDLLLAKKDDLVDGRIEYKRYKTGRLYSIKVEPEAMEIIKKYEGKDYLINFCDNGRDYHDVLSLINLQLKKIFPKLSTYYSRHTWATIASDLDVPIETISAALGHSHGAAVTNIYINFDRKKIDEANRKVIDYVLGK